ncbi:MAG: hypothetical protein IKZ82_09320, partial [Clostridia bacterium]|nr:hypothetical protein [Clostridia bacterium]
MKKTEFTSIDFPKVDAENYDMHDADTLRRVFFKSDDKYAKLISKDIYFLIGAKGSGKTMYAKYLQFCDDSIDVEYYPIRTEDYLKFIEMFADGKLKYTDFKTIWKAILLVKLITSIEKNDIDKWPGKGRIYAPIAKLKESDILTKIVSDGFAPRTDEYSRTDGAELNFELGAEPDVIKSGISTKNSTETSLSSKTEYTVYLDRWNAFF